MTRQILISFTFLLAIWLPSSLSAQTTFEAYSSVRQVVSGEYFDVSFILRNADGDNFNPPDFHGFRVVRGPSRSISRTIINGESSSELTYTYLLEAQKPGTHKIGYATIRVGKETIRSSTISIRVNERTEAPVDSLIGDEPIFIRAVPSTNKAYPGQQIILDYKLYTSIGVENYSVVAEGDYQGFFAQPLRRFRGRTQTETIGGQTYQTIVFRRVAIFPQLVGTLTITPLHLQAGINRNGNSNSRGFFFQPLDVIPLQTEPVDIEVMPLPGIPPDNFCGGVGEYELRASYDRQRLTTDDAITVRLAVSGTGDVKRLEPPVWVSSDSFEVYNPTTINEEMQENQGELVSSKIFEYQILPLYPGLYRLEPQISVFDPDSSQFVTLSASPVDIVVGQGNGQPRNAPSDDSESADEVAELRPLKEKVPLHIRDEYWLGSRGYWLAAIPAPILFLLFFGWRKVRDRREGIDPAELRRRKALKVAVARLSTAKSFLDQQNNRAFFDEVSKATLGFLTDKVGIPPAQQKKATIRSAMLGKGISENTTERLLALLQKCELALFAGQADQEAREEVYEEGVAVITQITDQLANT